MIGLYIAAAVVAYGACSIIAVYVDGFIQSRCGTVDDSGRFLAAVLGPFALLLMAFYFVSRAGRERGGDRR